MVDESNVLRMTPADRKLKEVFEARWKDFTEEMKGYQPPAREDLERVVEETTKCGKCAGGVRAILAEVQESRAFAFDLEILASLNCRDATCGWSARQWRTWTRTKPLEL